MLSDKARFQIYGLALQTHFEDGDFLDILKSIQNDARDYEVAILSFRFKWQKVKRILISVGAWVTRFEALELLEVFMKMYRINNREIWESILHTDEDLYLWDKKKSLTAFWEERKTATLERKKEIDRLAIIKAIINTCMLETKVMQDSEYLKRLDVVFRKELQIVADKLKHYQILCTPDDLGKLIQEEFPKLPASYLNYIKKYYPQILAGYDPVDFELPSQMKDPTASLEDEFDSVFANALVAEEISPLQTREPITMINEENHLLAINLEGKYYEITVSGIIDLLYKMISDFSAEEIYDRATDQIRSFRRHARDEDKLETFWLIIDRAEKELHKQWVDEKELKAQRASEDEIIIMRKLGKIISSLGILKTEMGNDIALLFSLKLAKK